MFELARGGLGYSLFAYGMCSNNSAAAFFGLNITINALREGYYPIPESYRKFAIDFFDALSFSLVALGVVEEIEPLLFFVMPMLQLLLFFYACTAVSSQTCHSGERESAVSFGY